MIARILPRQRNTKYHKRTYWYESVVVLVILSTLAVGVLAGWYFGGNW